MSLLGSAFVDFHPEMKNPKGLYFIEYKNAMYVYYLVNQSLMYCNKYTPAQMSKKTLLQKWMKIASELTPDRTMKDDHGSWILHANYISHGKVTGPETVFEVSYLHYITDPKKKALVTDGDDIEIEKKILRQKRLEKLIAKRFPEEDLAEYWKIVKSR